MYRYNYIILYYIILYYIILYYIKLYQIILYYFILYYIILYFIIVYFNLYIYIYIDFVCIYFFFESTFGSFFRPITSCFFAAVAARFKAIAGSYLLLSQTLDWNTQRKFNQHFEVQD